MKTILTIFGIITLLIFGTFFVVSIVQHHTKLPTKSFAQPQYTDIPIRIVSNYIDTTGYYDTVIFTEEDSILSIY